MFLMYLRTTYLTAFHSCPIIILRSPEPHAPQVSREQKPAYFPTTDPLSSFRRPTRRFSHLIHPQTLRPVVVIVPCLQQSVLRPSNFHVQKPVVSCTDCESAFLYMYVYQTPPASDSGTCSSSSLCPSLSSALVAMHLLSSLLFSSLLFPSRMYMCNSKQASTYPPTHPPTQPSNQVSILQQIKPNQTKPNQTKQNPPTHQAQSAPPPSPPSHTSPPTRPRPPRTCPRPRHPSSRPLSPWCGWSFCICDRLGR